MMMPDRASRPSETRPGIDCRIDLDAMRRDPAFDAGEVVSFPTSGPRSRPTTNIAARDNHRKPAFQPAAARPRILERARVVLVIATTALSHGRAATRIAGMLALTMAPPSQTAMSVDDLIAECFVDGPLCSTTQAVIVSGCLDKAFAVGSDGALDRVRRCVRDDMMRRR